MCHGQVTWNSQGRLIQLSWDSLFTGHDLYGFAQWWSTISHFLSQFIRWSHPISWGPQTFREAHSLMAKFLEPQRKRSLPLRQSHNIHTWVSVCWIGNATGYDCKYMGVSWGFHEWRYPKMDGLWWKIPLKWMISGYEYPPLYERPMYIHIYIYTYIYIYIHTYIHIDDIYIYI